MTRNTNQKEEKGMRGEREKDREKRKRNKKKKGEKKACTNGYEDRLRCSECAEWSRESHEQRLKRKGGNFF